MENMSTARHLAAGALGLFLGLVLFAAITIASVLV